MPTGTIKKIDERGFGFIKAATGPDVFFPHSVVAGRKFDSLEPDQVIGFEFDSANTAKGPRANSSLLI